MHPTQQLALADETYRLLCGREVAERLGVSTWVVKGIRLAGEFHGDSPFVGRYTRLPWVDAWLLRHPEFVASHFIPRAPNREAIPSGNKQRKQKERKTPTKSMKKAA